MTAHDKISKKTLVDRSSSDARERNWGAPLNGAYGANYVPGHHYPMVTPIKRPAKKPALAKANGKPVKAVIMHSFDRIEVAAKLDGSTSICRKRDSLRPHPVFVLPADVDSVAQMVEQVRAIILDAADSRADSVEMARAALAAIGVSGGKGAK